MRSHKISVFLLIITIIAFSCNKNNNYNFTISGKIYNAPKNTYAILYKALPTGNQPLDSAKIDPNGTFSFKATTHGKNFFIVSFTGQNYNIYLIADSAQNINITANYKDILRSYNVEGSPDSKLIQQIEQHLAKTRKKLDSLTALYQQLKNSGDTATLNALDRQIKQVLNAQKQYSINFVKTHYNNLAALPALSQVYIPGKSIFDPEQDAQLYFMVDTALGRLYPRNPQVLRLHTFVQNIKASLKRHQTRTYKIMPGTEAPNFTAKTINNLKCSLDQYKGKYIYLIFWSPWSKNDKPLQKALILQKNPNVQVITFALAANYKQIKDYLNQNSQYSKLLILADYKLWNSPIIRKYEVVKLPTVFLISPQGKILAINPSENDLKKFGL